MNFHEYALVKSIATDQAIKSIPTLTFYYMIYNELKKGEFHKDEDIYLTEMGYLGNRRPFYNVYPAVVSRLENTRLDFRLSQIDPLKGAVAICFGVGKEPIVKGAKVTSMLVQIGKDSESLTDGAVVDDPLIRIVMNRLCDDGKMRYSTIFYSGNDVLSEIVDTTDDKRKMISLAVGISMLASDERFFEPILLKKDQGKKLSGDALKRAIERAKNRGRNGNTIGKELDASPHMRRPHFAIRWTGKGGVTPKLVPVQGCIVNKSKLFPVPTGYMDDQGEA